MNLLRNMKTASEDEDDQTTRKLLKPVFIPKFVYKIKYLSINIIYIYK